MRKVPGSIRGSLAKLTNGKNGTFGKQRTLRQSFHQRSIPKANGKQALHHNVVGTSLRLQSSLECIPVLQVHFATRRAVVHAAALPKRAALFVGGPCRVALIQAHDAKCAPHIIIVSSSSSSIGSGGGGGGGSPTLLFLQGAREKANVTARSSSEIPNFHHRVIFIVVVVGN